MEIFVSVGTGLNPRQEAFVSAVEDRLRLIGLTPRTMGRNTFSTDAPLRAVADLMDRCSGAVVIAVERYRFSGGLERPGTDREKTLGEVAAPTSWNQIEASMAYCRDLPLLVLVEEGLRCEGLLEKGNDWFVHEVRLDPAELNRPAFTGLLESWRDKVSQRREPTPPPTSAPLDPGGMTVAQLVGALKPSQLWTACGAAAAALAGAFALGKLLG